MRATILSAVFITTFFCLFVKADLLQSAEIEKTPAMPLFTMEAGFLMPSDVAVGKKGRIYILDGTHGQVKVFNNQGILLFAFGSKGQGKEQLLNPLGLDIDDAGTVYVADSGNHRVQIFDYNGRWVNTFSLQKQKAHKPPDPTDVAVNSALNRCYVVDNDNHRVLIYDTKTYQLLGQWGTRGEVLGKFRYPFFISAGQDGAVAVVDLLNTRVQTFDHEGNFRHLVGDWGVNRGDFYRPKGITIDTHNHIIVSDSVLGVVQIFDPQGNFLSVVGNGEGEIMRFKNPVGIDIDKNHTLYVVEMSKNRVRAFKLKE